MYETTKEEIIQAQSGNENAMSNIIEKNSGLVWSIVKRFIGRGYETEDLYQIGCMGFVKAIKRFDASFEVKISTYAVPYILGEIKRFIRDDGPIKISRSIKELAIKIREIQNQYMNTTGEEVTIGKIAEELNVSKEEIAFALDSTRPLESINDDAYQENGDNKVSKLDKIVIDKDETSNIVDSLSIKELINNLEERDKKIILLRFYKEKTQSEVAKILGITQVQVSRLEKKILSSMKVKLV